MTVAYVVDGGVVLGLVSTEATGWGLRPRGFRRQCDGMIHQLVGVWYTSKLWDWT